MTSDIYVPYTAPEGFEILCIGESPGSDETRLLQPFVGLTGKLLREVLQANGIDCASSEDLETEAGIHGKVIARSYNNKYKVAFANLVNYQPQDNKFENFTEAEVKNGLQELNGFLDEHKGHIKVIILLGAKPLQYLCGKYGIDRFRGSILQYKGITCVPTFHPSFVSRVKSNYPLFSLDIQRAREIFEKGFTPPIFDFSIDPSGYQLEELYYECEKLGRVVVDIETVKYTNRILCIGIGLSRSRAFVVPNKSSDMLDSQCRDLSVRILENPEIEKIFHNGLFDIEILFNNQVNVVNFKDDTMVMRHVTQPELEKGLDDIVKDYTTIPYYKDKGKMTIPDNEKGWADTKNLDRLTLYEYNCYDCVGTFWCYEEMLKEIQDDECFSLIYPQEMEQHEVAFELMRNGMTRNEARTNEIREIVKRLYVENQKVLDGVIGRSINVGSPDQKKKLFYDEWGLPIKLKEGKVSADEDAIVSLIGYVKDYIVPLKTEAKRYEWQKKLVGLMVTLKLMGYRKLLGSYIDIKLHPSGKIRSVYKITGTETGRWSCSKYYDDTGLNAQTMPRESLEVA